MKHTMRISIILVCLFLIAQLIGLAIVNEYTPKVTTPDGETIPSDQIEMKTLPLGIERPEIEENVSYLPLIINNLQLF